VIGHIRLLNVSEAKTIARRSVFQRKRPDGSLRRAL
jgi:hypothetical protein